MRTALAICLSVVLLGVVALCAPLGCLPAAPAHPCCPRQHAPSAMQYCPSLLLEKGKIASSISCAFPVAALSGVPALQFPPSTVLAAAPDPHREQIFLLVRVLRI